jgi:hypothetical protein
MGSCTLKAIYVRLFFGLSSSTSTTLKILSVKGYLCANRITLMTSNAITRKREYCNYISIPR